ncbi:MAG: chromophore lyase CpcT/CpeT [Synechococcales cyanobacterium]
MAEADLQRVQHWLAGVYSNREQALDQPVWFIPVQLWYIPVPTLFAEGMGFFTEQIQQPRPDEFYRSRVLHLLDYPLRLENYRLREQSRWAGASRDPHVLAHLRPEDLIGLPSCTLYLTVEADRIHGAMDPQQECCLSPDADSRIEIEFDLFADAFHTLDRGFKRDSQEQVWGSRAGAYRYQRLA